MSEQIVQDSRSDNTDTEDTATDSPQTQPYPARDADNGEEQKNRLGYMVTEPTEEEIEGDESDESEEN